jgi:two-component system, OmpR family, response regulator VicR
VEGASVNEILVVDDEQEVAELMIYLLQSEGYGARHAPDGEVAVQVLQQNPAALILTDYMMPVMDGLQLLQALKAKEETAAIPVVMLSALPEEVVREKGEPVRAFLRKPFRATELLTSVRQILGPPRRS